MFPLSHDERDSEPTFAPRFFVSQCPLGANKSKPCRSEKSHRTGTMFSLAYDERDSEPTFAPRFF
jgi:hypothetical protein